jgi:hypothetical protein
VETAVAEFPRDILGCVCSGSAEPAGADDEVSCETAARERVLCSALRRRAALFEPIEVLSDVPNTSGCVEASLAPRQLTAGERGARRLAARK